MDLEERVQLDILIIDDVIEASFGAVAPQCADAKTLNAGTNEYIEVAMGDFLDLKVERKFNYNPYNHE